MWNWPETALSAWVYAKLKPGVLGNTYFFFFFALFFNYFYFSLLFCISAGQQGWWCPSPEPAGRRRGAFVSCPQGGRQPTRKRLCQEWERPSPGSAGSAAPGQVAWRGPPWAARVQHCLDITSSPVSKPVPRLSALKSCALGCQGNHLSHLLSQKSTQITHSADKKWVSLTSFFLGEVLLTKCCIYLSHPSSARDLGTVF